MQLESMSMNSNGVVSHGCDHDQDEDHQERNSRIRVVNLGNWSVTMI